VRSAGFSPDGRFVLTTSSTEDHTYAQVWDATTGQSVTTPIWHTGSISSASFNPDNRRFVTTSDGDGARVWNLKPDARSLDDLQRLAQVFSATRIGNDGALRPIEPEELREAYEALRSKAPEIFTASRVEVLGWHHQEALACEAAGAWEAALGHLNYLIEAGPALGALSLRRGLVHAELGHWLEAGRDLDIR